MTAREAFALAYLRVARAQLVAGDPDHADECFRQVAHADPALFDPAATILNGRCRFLPKPAEWRAAVAEAAAIAERARFEDVALPAGPEAGDVYCVQCADTGWVYVEARRVAACACRPTNPVYQRGRREQVRAAAGRDEAAKALRGLGIEVRSF